MERIDLDQLKKKVTVDPNTSCWNWTGAMSARGVCIVQIGGKQWRARRAFWIARFGPIPAGNAVGVRCRNPLCMHHLAIHPMPAKMTGGFKPNAGRKPRLDSAAVTFILTEGKDIKNAALALQFGVSRSLISLVKNGKRQLKGMGV